MNRLSDCCGEKMYDDIDMCMSCKEHCAEQEMIVMGMTASEMADDLVVDFIPIMNTGTGLITYKQKELHGIDGALKCVGIVIKQTLNYNDQDVNDYWNDVKNYLEILKSEKTK